MTTTLKKQKLDCFVDETGQDTQGEFFLVAVVIDEQPDDPHSALEQIEEASKKGLRKWFHAGKERRHAYIQQVVDFPPVIGFYYSLKVSQSWTRFACTETSENQKLCQKSCPGMCLTWTFASAIATSLLSTACQANVIIFGR